MLAGVSSNINDCSPALLLIVYVAVALAYLSFASRVAVTTIKVCSESSHTLLIVTVPFLSIVESISLIVFLSEISYFIVSIFLSSASSSSINFA